MEGPLRGCLAGAAAWKWGGGCVSTIVIFLVVFWLLGHVKCWVLKTAVAGRCRSAEDLSEILIPKATVFRVGW